MTTRYTRKYDEVLLRREPPQETSIRYHIDQADRITNQRYISRLAGSTAMGSPNMWGASVTILPEVYDVSLSDLAYRRMSVARELRGFLFSSDQTWKPEELIGRVSGDDAWKKMRGEDGKLCSTDGSESREKGLTSSAVGANQKGNGPSTSILSHLRVIQDEKIDMTSLHESKKAEGSSPQLADSKPWLVRGIITRGSELSGQICDITVVPSSVNAIMPDGASVTTDISSRTEEQFRILNEVMKLHVSATLEDSMNCKIACDGVAVVNDRITETYSSSSITIDSGGVVEALSIPHGVSNHSDTNHHRTSTEGSDDLLKVGTDISLPINNYNSFTLKQLDLCRFRFCFHKEQRGVEFSIVQDYICSCPSLIVRIDMKELPELLSKYLSVSRVRGCCLDPKKEILLVFEDIVSACYPLSRCTGALAYIKRCSVDSLKLSDKTSSVPASKSLDCETALQSVPKKSEGEILVDHSADIVNSECGVFRNEVVPDFFYFSVSSRQAYPDTQHFDTTQFLYSWVDMCGLVCDPYGSSEYKKYNNRGIMLTEIIIRSGKHFLCFPLTFVTFKCKGVYVNGISCIYSLPVIEKDVKEFDDSSADGKLKTLCFHSTDVSGDNDDPTYTTIAVDMKNDPIVKVRVRSGGWVDSIEFTTKSGKVTR